MFLSRFLLPFFALVSTDMPRVFASESESSDDNCIATLEELEAVMSLPRTDDSIVTYVLCSDTEYFTGEIFDFGETSFPIIPRSNSKIQCGEDGSSDDNCVVSGNISFLSSSFFSSGNPLDPIVNVSVEGLTFKGGEFANAGILLAAEGDITFTDCIIEDHQNTGAVSLLFFTFVPDRIQKITFDKCVFRNNSYGPLEDFTEASNPGVIGIETAFNMATVKNCIFEDNFFGDDSVNENGQGFGPDGWAIFVAAGATLTLEDNCFINNDFVGKGVVIADLEGAVTSSGNFGSPDDGLDCEFLAQGSSCTGYEEDDCQADSGDSEDSESED